MTPISSTITREVGLSATLQPSPSVLKQLRVLIPTRDCEPDEGTTIAERQATHPRRLRGAPGQRHEPLERPQLDHHDQPG